MHIILALLLLLAPLPRAAAQSSYSPVNSCAGEGMRTEARSVALGGAVLRFRYEVTATNGTYFDLMVSFMAQPPLQFAPPQRVLRRESRVFVLGTGTEPLTPQALSRLIILDCQMVPGQR